MRRPDVKNPNGMLPTLSVDLNIKPDFWVVGNPSYFRTPLKTKAMPLTVGLETYYLDIRKVLLPSPREAYESSNGRMDQESENPYQSGKDTIKSIFKNDKGIFHKRARSQEMNETFIKMHISDILNTTIKLEKRPMPVYSSKVKYRFPKDASGYLQESLKRSKKSILNQTVYSSTKKGRDRGTRNRSMNRVSLTTNSSQELSIRHSINAARANTRSKMCKITFYQSVNLLCVAILNSSCKLTTRVQKSDVRVMKVSPILILQIKSMILKQIQKLVQEFKIHWE